MRYTPHLPPSLVELDLIRLETIDLLRDRFRLSEDLAERVVARSRSVDQAIAIAELMR
jgi:hypothetical protein